MSKSVISLCCLTIAFLSACTPHPETNETVTHEVPTVSEPPIKTEDQPRKVDAFIAKTLIGALASNKIDEQLSPSDRAYSNQALRRGLNSGRPQNWQNPETGVSGDFYPETLVQSNTGRYCRPYNQTIFVNGNPTSARGRACRKPDNTWDIIR